MIELIVMHKTERLGKDEIEYTLAERLDSTKVNALSNLIIKTPHDLEVGDILVLRRKNEG